MSLPEEPIAGGVSGEREPGAGDHERQAADEIARQAKANLKSLVSDDSSQLPSLGVIADAIRLELEASGQVAILYVKLKRFGRLERIFGWGIIGEILSAIARNLREMVGSTLRALDVLADFTLSDNAFVVVLSPPRSGKSIGPDDLLMVRRRVYERLQGTLMNDLATGVYDRVHPFVGAAIIQADAALTFEQNLQRGVALAMEAAEEDAIRYDAELEATLAELLASEDLEPLFQPVVDVRRKGVIGYHATSRGPFYSPLRLPDVLDDVARRSPLLGTYGVAAREAAVAGAVGLMPEELLFVGCAATELPNAAIVALSEFYSLNTALVPQHVVFEMPAADFTANPASTVRTLAQLRETGFQLCVTDLGGELTVLELVAQAQPDFLSLDPMLVAGTGSEDVPAGDPTVVDAVALLSRFAARQGAQLTAPDVTTTKQLDTLRRVGVELIRGDLVARPDTRLPKVSLSRLGL
jgi:EAL domain-containing protein (putative c-di-GMP-specific phosphodiesterase class I)/GGDEF domain-containing protein